jgi:hypothetical protein
MYARLFLGSTKLNGIKSESPRSDESLSVATTTTTCSRALRRLSRSQFTYGIQRATLTGFEPVLPP